jgi:hypothetical protein
VTYSQISLEKTRTQHRLLTHYLPLYFPEIERHYHASRSEWLLAFLQVFPTPALIARLSMEDFVQQAWPVVGRKVSKQRAGGPDRNLRCMPCCRGEPTSATQLEGSVRSGERPHSWVFAPEESLPLRSLDGEWN